MLRLPADQYGCVVAPPGSDSRLRVLVRSPSSVPLGRSIIRRLGGTPYATVRVQPGVRLARDRRALIAELRRQAVRYRPNDAYDGAATVMDGAIVDRTTCGPVILRRPRGPKALAAWVRRAAAQHPGAVEVRPSLTVRPTPVYPNTLGLERDQGPG